VGGGQRGLLLLYCGKKGGRVLLRGKKGEILNYNAEKRVDLVPFAAKKPLSFSAGWRGKRGPPYLPGNSLLV